ncbi:MAG: tRNA uridine-5-carboxymethylaminomethyl(34) synthesis GTPase MnmE [Clostridiales bacterium]|nr:tRNA uridine-5-carboxymethylaminomethyl(34) synthesis GTPase MnmE [Clostridiales bacterium]
MEDTIAAIATSSGISSIGIIRISGENAFDIIKKIFKTKKDNFEIKANTINYGYIVDEGNIIDEVLVSFFVKPNSFTREDVCEINCHGGTVIINKILALVLKNGARLANPGEFTQRAFLNGRIDLSQAEAIIDIINSKTDKILKESEKQLKGNLSNEITEIENTILDILSDIEANIDYPEYDVEEVSERKLREKVEEIKNKLLLLENSFETGKILKEGISIALIGRPNVGKSSVLNMLLKEQRAIVTDIAGTTRDTIEEYINIKGIPVKIIDTAGIRDTKDIVEKIGVDKSLELVETADVVVLILDSSSKLNKQDIEILTKIKTKNSLVILNKIDLNKEITEKNILDINSEVKIIAISAKENIGKEKIEQEIFNICNINEVISENEVIVTNTRHKDVISRALNIIIEAQNNINENVPIDIISIKIMESLKILGEITGKTVSEEVISKIFSKFCLGK